MRNERWSTPSEIKRGLHSDVNSGGGPILYYANGRKWVHTGEGHVLTLGVSGSGKSRRYCIPLLRTFMEAKESFVAIDPKGELWKQTSCYIPREYEVHCIDFRHVFESEHYNPLSAAYELFKSGDPIKKQIAQEMVDELAKALYPCHEKADPFWPQSAASLFCGVVFSLMEYAKPEEVNMASVYQFVAKGEERFGGPNNTYLKEFVNLLPEDSIGAMLMTSYANTASDTQAGIRSTFLEGLSIYARSEGLVEMLSKDDLHINSLSGDKPLALYIIIPDERSNYDAVAGNMVSQLLSHFVRTAEENVEGKLGRRLNVLLEELGNIGASINSLDHMMTASRSRGIRVHLILQALSQLDSIYGTSKASTIRSNADVLLAFRTSHWDTLVELSRKCGQREIGRDGHITGKDDLITPAQLAAMECGQGLCIISGRTKFITWIPDYSELFDLSNWQPPRHEVRRQCTENKTYDIRKHVKTAKKKRMEAMMSEQSNEMMTPSFMSPEPNWLLMDDTTEQIKKTVPNGDPEFNVDELIKRIDSKIAELEAEEEKKKQENKKRKPRSYKVTLTNSGEHPGKVMKVVRNTMSVSLKEASECVKNLPHTFYFERKMLAQNMKEALTEVGATVE